MFDTTVLIAAMAAIAPAARLVSGQAVESSNRLPRVAASALLQRGKIASALPDVLLKRAILLTDVRMIWGVVVRCEIAESPGEASLLIDESVAGAGRQAFAAATRNPLQDCCSTEIFAVAAQRMLQVVDCAHAYSTSTVIVDFETETPVLAHTVLLLRYQGFEVITRQELVEQRTGTVVPTVDRAGHLAQTGICGMNRTALAAKRAVDLALTLTGLVFLVPLMFAIAVAVQIESGGPVIYRQLRVGRHGRAFWILKFRTMNVDAEIDGKARWAARDDHRVTRVGRVLRRSRLDELPQLINVLRGEMSLVGPRPERPEFVRQLAEVIPAYDLRHLVRPGLTGWAQINYRYGASIDDARRKLGFDLYYVQQCSIGADLFILARTLGVVLFGVGAR